MGYEVDAAGRFDTRWHELAAEATGRHANAPHRRACPGAAAGRQSAAWVKG